MDRYLLDQIAAHHEIEVVFHLAALLSTRGERDPELAHQVNVEGTLHLLRMANNQSQRLGRAVRFLFPSSIAVYGLPNVEEKTKASRVREEAWNISAETVPTGGTSDFGPEMLHAAAQGKPYACFVRPDARIPFMAMPDAVQALVGLLDADKERLTQTVYNVGAFSPSAGEIASQVRKIYPNAEITYEPDPVRGKIVDSWPEDVDDSAARKDWDWKPAYDFERAMEEYLVPGLKGRYAT
jgi:nucleoside-diphosphate-sugar epimerase